MAADTRASSSVDDLIVPVTTDNGKEHKTRSMHLVITQGENSVDARGAPGG